MEAYFISQIQDKDETSQTKELKKFSLEDELKKLEAIQRNQIPKGRKRRKKCKIRGINSIPKRSTPKISREK